MTADFLHGPGVDAPLVENVTGQSACYYATVGNRLVSYFSSNGLKCSGTRWGETGHMAGAIASSYSFGQSRSDEQSGVSYYRNRMYDSRTGRFTSQDPIGFAGGMNLYTYSGNNPASYTDPFGLCPEDKGGDGKTDRLDDCPEGSEGYNEYQEQLQAQQAAEESFKECMKDAAALGVAAVGTAVGGGVAVAGRIMQTQGSNAVAEGTRLIDRFRAIRFPSSGLIEDGIAMINNGRAAVAAGAVALKAGASIAAFAGGYGLGATAMCAIDPTYYRE